MITRRSILQHAGIPALSALRVASEAAAAQNAPRIWDLHCHILNAPGRTPEARLERLIEFADRMGIERVCVFKGARGDRDRSPDDLREQNDELMQALRRWNHRALGFVYLKPKHLDFS